MYDGRINTQGNAGFTASTDGTCSGPTQFVRTVVQAPDVPTANNLCLSLGCGTVAGTLNSFGYNTAPAGVWLCSGFS